ncbi:membrane protein [Pontibacillus halophilus JSM 076056 = DSM 19796]|uniref:Membrane protein n=1 Tax=Pontibacillus halophilus JSM 076056 = DSM 19796 TaxID=1385510 RepID=A0A0A5ICK7_9BACI|nr:YqzM family protein [Pontibacillus halophilus]KGX93562.1 membrane protein [Pontibacillus halophilus JSM 076056 = DSM 19796]
MNEFKKEVQSPTNDVIDSGKGFITSFLFFMVIFFIGTLVNVLVG